jgi:class 3 adenylate cyclase
VGPCPEEAGKKPVASLICMSSGSIRRRRGEALLLIRWGGAVTTETRKLAAILAADVVGFSRLTGADEARMSRG